MFERWNTDPMDMHKTISRHFDRLVKRTPSNSRLMSLLAHFDQPHSFSRPRRLPRRIQNLHDDDVGVEGTESALWSGNLDLPGYERVRLGVAVGNNLAVHHRSKITQRGALDWRSEE